MNPILAKSDPLTHTRAKARAHTEVLTASLFQPSSCFSQASVSFQLYPTQDQADACNQCLCREPEPAWLLPFSDSPNVYARGKWLQVDLIFFISRICWCQCGNLGVSLNFKCCKPQRPRPYGNTRNLIGGGRSATLPNRGG